MTDFALIPAYNEEDNIEEVLRRLKKVRNLIPLVVDDGSKDKTAELAKKNGAIVVKHKKNKGKGETLRTGFEYLLKRKDMKYVVIIDSDLQFFPEESIRLLNALRKGANFVCGYRDFKKLPFLNRFGNNLWAFAFNFLFSADFRDTNSGFIGMDAKTVSILREKTGGGYIVDNSIRAEAVRNKLKIRQVPVSIAYHEKRKLTFLGRMLLGNFYFIVKEGIKFRLGIKN